MGACPARRLSAVSAFQADFASLVYISRWSTHRVLPLAKVKREVQQQGSDRGESSGGGGLPVVLESPSRASDVGALALFPSPIFIIVFPQVT